MLFRSCAGGVVFYEDMVFLLLNEKKEWVLPKGAIRSGMLSQEIALERIREEAGINAQILCSAGETCYEFYSLTRKMPVCNEVAWYVMQAKDGATAPNRALGFIDGKYFPVIEALSTITYSQDKALVRLAYQKYRAVQDGK